MKMHKLRNLLICLCLCFALTACAGLAQDLSTTYLGEYCHADESPASYEAEILPLEAILFNVGDIPVTFAEFLFQYKIVVHAFFNSGQFNYYGVDADLPLDEQYYNEEADVTWQKMFEGSVHDALSRNLAMYQEAQAQGRPTGDWEKDYIQGFLGFIEDSSREQSITADEFVGRQYGDGLTLAMVTEYQERYWSGVGYETSRRESHTFTDSEIEAFYEQKKNQVDLPDCTVVTLRNIFLYDKEAAHDLLEEFDREDKTEEVFIRFARAYSDDETSKENGGLYENYRPSGTEAGFTEMEAWLFDDARSHGDIKIHEWDNGIELVYFVSKGEPFWKVWSRENLLEDYFDQIIDKYPVVYPES